MDMATDKALVYCGLSIAIERERICLTDMWRASGSVEGKEVWRWAETEQAKQWINFVTDNFNLAKNEVWIVDRGQRGSTWAHWQIALAFARYLSHELHAYMNEVFRDHIERRHHEILPAYLIDVMRKEAREGAREGAIEGTKEVNNNVVQFRNEQRERECKHQKEFQEHRRATENKRKDFSAANQRKICLTVLWEFGGKDPIDRRTRIVDDDGNPIEGKFNIDHWNGRRSDVSLTNAFPCTPITHQKLEYEHGFRDRHVLVYKEFHRALQILEEERRFAKARKVKKPRPRTVVDDRQKDMFNK
jgi:hypothetical protein